jgi:hypothetical protein
MDNPIWGPGLNRPNLKSVRFLQLMSNSNHLSTTTVQLNEIQTSFHHAITPMTSST